MLLKVPASPMPKASDQQLLDDAVNKVLANLSKSGGQAPELLEFAAAADKMVKAGFKPHHILTDLAHKSVAAFSRRLDLQSRLPDPDRHSGMTMAHMHKAHFHLTKVEGMACAGHAAEIPGEPNRLIHLSSPAPEMRCSANP